MATQAQLHTNFPAHPIKIERHDTSKLMHYTSKGGRTVDLYNPTPHGLFVARKFEGHPTIRYWQAHILPKLNLVVCRYDFYGQKEHDYYIDVADITREGTMWSVRDLYLDLIVQEGASASILDTDELLASHEAGFIGTAELQSTILIAHKTLKELASVGYSMQAWSESKGIKLPWLEIPVFREAQFTSIYQLWL